MSVRERSSVLAFLFFILALPGISEAQWQLQSKRLNRYADSRELKEVLKELENGYEVFFSYDAATLKDKKTRLKVDRSLELEQQLARILTPLDLRFEQVSAQVYAILPAQKAVSLPGSAPQPAPELPAKEQKAQALVSGTVSDSLENEPLPGVSIIVKGSQRGTVTDMDGKFEIALEEEQAVLVVSFLGYVSKEVPVSSGQQVDIVLASDLQALNEVVVVGYGTQKKITLTSSVSSIDAKEISKAPVTNISNALVGRLPGLIAVNGNGKPGSGSSISIRGASTFGDNSALIVVDGIVRDFQFIDPNEIESVSILKDASATAVYGSRAANGVILITTKRGSEGKPTFNYNGFVGMQSPTRYPDVLSAYEYALTKNQAVLNAGKPAQYSPQELEDIRTGVIPETDWYGLTLKDQSFQTQQNISVNGGTEAIKYYLSLGYLDQDGMYDRINFKRYSIRSNVDANINDNLTISADFDASTRDHRASAYSAEAIFDDIVAAYPMDLAYNPDGTIFYTHEQHPVEEIKTGYNNTKVNILQATLSLKQKLPFVEGLSVSGRASFGKEYSNNKHYNVPILMNRQDAEGNTLEIYPYGGWNGKTSLRQGFDEYNTTTLNASLNYQRSFGDHDVSGLLLFEQFDAKSNNFFGFRTNFPAEGLDEFFYGGEAQKDANGGSFNDGRRSTVARVNYTYKQRYMFEASFRRDGSVAFPENKKYGFFPAVSAGWRLGEESFIRDNDGLAFIDNLKLRASYGEVGNDRNVYDASGRVPTFQYLQAFNPSGTIVSGSEGLSSIAPGILPNPNVTWETATIADVGLEGSLWKSKLEFIVDVFYKRTSDILLERIRSIPATLGAQLPAENYAEVDNKGIEMSFTHRNQVGALNFYVTLNGSFSKSKVITLDEPANIPDYLLQTGRPLGFITGYQAIGFFQSEEDIASYYPQFNGGQQPGDVKYADINGDQKVDANDITIISMDNSTPKVIGGLSFGGSVKRFDFAVLFQGATKVNRLLDGMARNFFLGGSRNTFTDLLDYWTPDNRDALYPRPWEGPHPTNSLTSSLYLRDASYIRLKSVDLGYTFSDKVVKGIGVERLRIYLSGTNLLTLDKLKMFDPEVENPGGSYYPQQRTMNLGLNLTF
ncbi:TonB-linked SusC/RagA family outer membrane protein [Anseongella ginsenosidimutans]|uniref:TonB-linked SusC/RagA family outer membrane protein n=1 Tax=Anseongella ginsenosidimutans TaxID=496056 RepID=A0A4R3KXF2_9SPHI|nr:TonB-dependent receptor [Anseongella ginsenosidimutans]QEC51381.1 TonB-dependent receptor [Anseongella ginsenosidimutans]TCS89914.1 TonB-linked SusC/RagA family outer membrane protein [Anseongella ginsenosidimutans]